MKIRIPVLVSRSGEMHTGYAAVDPDGNIVTDDVPAHDSMSEDGHDFGTQLVEVEAEIDLDEVFDLPAFSGVITPVEDE